MCRTGVGVFLTLRLNERRFSKIFTTGREPESDSDSDSDNGIYIDIDNEE